MARCTFLMYVLTCLSMRSNPQDSHQKEKMELESHIWTATVKQVEQFFN